MRMGANAGPGFWLMDAIFRCTDKTITPYRGVRYHLAEWARNSMTRPSNPKELYNLRHAVLRNCVERIIGVVRRKFGLLHLERLETYLGDEGDEYLTRYNKIMLVIVALFNELRMADDGTCL